MRPLHDIPDEKLAERANKGDEGAFEELILRHELQVKRWIRWIDRRAERVDDIAQEVFIKAWRFKKDFRGDSSYRTWIMKIALRTCRDWQRRREPTGGKIDPDSLPDHILTGDADVEQVVLDKIDLERVREAMDSLSNEHREVVVLRYMEGYNSSEIGEITGRPAGTIRRILSDSLDKMRSALKTGEKSRGFLRGGIE